MQKAFKVDSISSINTPNDTNSKNQNEDVYSEDPHLLDNTQRLNWKDVSLGFDTVLKHITRAVSIGSVLLLWAWCNKHIIT